MSIFKNLSTTDKKKMLKYEHKTVEFKTSDNLFVSMCFILWNDNEKNPQLQKMVESWKLNDAAEIRDAMNGAEIVKAMRIAKLKNINSPIVKIGAAYYNPEFVYFGLAALGPACIYQTKQKMPLLYMTDGENKFVLMPMRVNAESEFDRKKIIEPANISAEDVEKARKYKLHLSKSHAPEHTNFSEKNILVSRGEYFVTIPKSNKFLREVFDCESDKPEDYSDGDILFEFDENQTKHTEDLFHKKVVYAKAVQGYGRDREFYHLYENGTGVCFNA